MPFPFLLALFLALPLLEIATFVAVGSEIGVAWTLLLVIAASVGGIMVVRRQSFATLRSARAEARAGRVPEREIVHGALVVLAGLLLILPGFLTDLAALLLLVPPVRDLLWRRMRSRIVVVDGAPRSGVRWTRGAFQRRGEARPAVLDLDDAEFHRAGDGEAPTDPDSPWRPADGTADGQGRDGPR